MRKQYKRTAYLLDDDILLEGYVDLKLSYEVPSKNSMK